MPAAELMKQQPPVASKPSRRRFVQEPARQWVAFGVYGLSPYWFEPAATGYAGDGGCTAARVRADYELLITQRPVLQSALKANLCGQSDPARQIRRGLSDAQLSFRRRYEINRQVAPCVGLL